MNDGKRLDAPWYNDAQLPSGAVPIYQPERYDVLLGRGRGHVTNPGNRRLQIAVNMHKDRYNSSATTRAEKTKITTDIVHFIKCCGSEQGRFLKYHGISGCWFEVEDEVARLKVSQALRYTRRSSTSSNNSFEDQDSVTSRSSTVDAEPAVPRGIISAEQDLTRRSNKSDERGTSEQPMAEYDTVGALEPIGPDFEW